MFKKSVLFAVVASFCLAVVQPAKSEAGIILGVASGGGVGGAVGGAGIALAVGAGLSVVGGGAAMVVAAMGGGDLGPGQAVFAIAGVLFTSGVLPGMILLDADGSLPQGELEAFLRNELSWLDNPEVISDTALQIKNRFAEAQKVHPEAGALGIAFSRDEVIDLLAPAGISPEESPVEFAEALRVLN